MCQKFCSSHVSYNQLGNCLSNIIQKNALVFLFQGITLSLEDLSNYIYFIHNLFIPFLLLKCFLSHSVLIVKVSNSKLGLPVFFFFLFVQVRFEKCMWVSKLLLSQPWFPIKGGTFICIYKILDSSTWSDVRQMYVCTAVCV